MAEESIVSTNTTNSSGSINETRYTPPLSSIEISEFPDEFIEIKLNSVDQLVSFPNIDIQFIVQLGDGIFYTSSSYKDSLKNLEYSDTKFNILKLAKVIQLNRNELSTHFNKNKFKIGELYSEINITKTISSPEEILIHIDWVCSQSNEFRNTEFDKSITLVNGKTITGIGSWDIIHDPNGNFGLQYEDDFSKINKDKLFAEEQFDGVLNRSSSTIIQSDELASTTTTIDDSVDVVPTYPPFNERGTDLEKRKHTDGFFYFFNPKQDKWRREDSLDLNDKEIILQNTSPEEYAEYEKTYRYQTNNLDDIPVLKEDFLDTKIK